MVREGVAEEAWRCYDSLQETMLGSGGHWVHVSRVTCRCAGEDIPEDVSLETYYWQHVEARVAALEAEGWSARDTADLRLCLGGLQLALAE